MQSVQMTPQQQLEYEQDQQMFRALFVKDLARELALLLSDKPTPILVAAYEELLDKRLPEATAANWVLAKDHNSRR